MESRLKTPVIFLIFNRPEETARVFEAIRQARPPKLFIVADGPRNAQEKKSTDAARAVVETIDWDCVVHRDYSETNLGCRKRVSSGISWAFGSLENDSDGAIILEDDCLPNQSFFTFTEEMLLKYKDNPRILHIGGTNFQSGNPRFNPQESYYFSHIAQIWGWATWKRAWKLYDAALTSWPALRQKSNGLRNIFPNTAVYGYWKYVFDRMHANAMDTWDIAWTYTCFKENGLCVMPKSNLVTNIGDKAGATHKGNRLIGTASAELDFPLIHSFIQPFVHPAQISADKDADIYTYSYVFGINQSTQRKLISFIKEKLPFLFHNVQRLMK